MSNENALFEDDFDVEFEDFETEDYAANDDGFLDDEVRVDAPMKDLSPIDSLFEVPSEGGDRVIPAISINAFCERADTQQILEHA